MTTILVDDSGVLKCMTYVPKKPNEKEYLRKRSPGFNDFIKADSDYHKALEKAKEDAIEFDQSFDKELIIDKLHYQACEKAGVYIESKTPSPGLYEVDVEVEIETIWLREVDAQGNQMSVKVARIKSPQPEESQEELWNEAISLIVDFPGSYESKDLIEKFSITRRKPLN